MLNKCKDCASVGVSLESAPRPEPRPSVHGLSPESHRAGQFINNQEGRNGMEWDGMGQGGTDQDDCIKYNGYLYLRKGALCLGVRSPERAGLSPIRAQLPWQH